MCTHHWDLSNRHQTRTCVVLVLWMRLMWVLFFDDCVIVCPLRDDAPSRWVWNLKRRHFLARWPWKRTSGDGFFYQTNSKNTLNSHSFEAVPLPFEFGGMTKHTSRLLSPTLERFVSQVAWPLKVQRGSFACFFLFFLRLFDGVSKSKSMEALGHLSHKTENSRSKRRRAAESGRKITSRRFISGEEGKTLSLCWLVFLGFEPDTGTQVNQSESQTSQWPFFELVKSSQVSLTVSIV